MNVPLKKTKFVPVEYWDCGKEEHTHGKQSAAERCMRGQQAKAKAKAKVKLKRNKHTQAALAIINGTTYKQAGIDLGVSAERIRQMSNKVFREATRQYVKAGLKEFPEGVMTGVNWYRENKDFWLKGIDLASDYWNLKD